MSDKTIVTRLLCLMLVTAAAIFFAPAAYSADSPAGLTTSDLDFQVSALTTLDELNLSLDQLKSLQALAAHTAAHVDPAAAEGNSEYRSALRSLRDALVKGDDEKIDPAQDKVDSLRDAQSIDPDLDLPFTDAAKSKAAAAIKVLTSSQIAAYIAAHADEVPDATETITDAIDQCKEGSDEVFNALRDEAADQVGLLVAGLDETAADPVVQKVRDLLDRARKLSAADLAGRRTELDAQARAITHAADSFEALHHWMAGEMADLLSNPQIAAVLSARIQADSKN